MYAVFFFVLCVLQNHYYYETGRVSRKSKVSPWSGGANTMTAHRMVKVEVKSPCKSVKVFVQLTLIRGLWRSGFSIFEKLFFIHL